MRIHLKINGRDTEIDANPNEKLLDILRAEKIFSAKAGCGKGRCGVCTVLLDGKPVPSCRIPIGTIDGADVTTLEHFKTTQSYENIANGLKKAGVHLCGFCSAAKILSVHELLESKYRPTREECLEFAEGLSCTCTEKNAFMNAILYATAFKHDRDGMKS
ncbi:MULTISPECIES: (2Fe-2S)-binding protein [Treponema]|uniref:(2Fe-2S)-binding protein n=1 Tax=Treponema TaxID=157 RepID=UPI00257A3DA1|nr:2Fe-2S iron-sulfur cluster-binding protein [Treponema sp.]MBQ5536366.1 2Fe-2S iron-sulfur cluster binding domain-containing protein [Treponema sp.]